MTNSSLNFAALEKLARRDPAGRGLSGFQWQGELLAHGQLATAASSLVGATGAVAIVTGFAVHDGQAYVPETDGPPGALALADVLEHHRREVVLISDPLGIPALQVGCQALGLSPALLAFPFDDADETSPARHSNDPGYGAASDAWTAQFFSSPMGRRISQLISIERVGPSHTPQSLLAQDDSRAWLDDFLLDVPAEHRNVCHNMRGEAINARTAKTHRLFEWVQAKQLPINTIGIGDGGNELGMGQFPWRVLREAIARGPGGRIACRIATDTTLLTGVSNWGGYVLAAAVDRLLGSDHFARTWNAAREDWLLGELVAKAHCVDGVSRRHEPTVDGLSAEQSHAFWRGLEEILKQPSSPDAR